MRKKATKSYRIEALGRAISILKVFSHDEPQLTMTEIVERTGISSATTYRMLSHLCAENLCQFDQLTGRYSLGSEVLRLADIRWHQSSGQQLALPVLARIRDNTNETVILSVREGDYRVQVAAMESAHSLRRAPELGRRTPLYVGGSGKVFLAAMSDDDLDDYLARTELTPFSTTTLTDEGVLRREIATIRKRGYAEGRGEYIPGGRSVAIGIPDGSGEAVFAIHVAFVSDRFTKDARKSAIEELRRGGADLSEQLGYRA